MPTRKTTIRYVIPKAYGGTDGPLVSLCETHHGKLHKIALCLENGSPHFQLVQTETDAEKQKLYWLATCVYNAKMATKKDPNKTSLVMMRLKGPQVRMIDKLKKVYPQAKSREAVLALALQALYQRAFPQ